MRDRTNAKSAERLFLLLDLITSTTRSQNPEAKSSDTTRTISVSSASLVTSKNEPDWIINDQILTFHNMQNKPWQTTHGLSRTRFYRVYKNICTRWRNPNYKDVNYAHVYCEWKNFDQFMEDMYEWYLAHSEEYWEKNTTIDRLDNKKWYSKENCRWATMRMQVLNRTNSLTYKWRAIADICKDQWIKYNTVIYRIKRWWDIWKAIYTPVK